MLTELQGDFICITIFGNKKVRKRLFFAVMSADYPTFAINNH